MTLTILLCLIGLLMAFSTTSTYYFNDGGQGNPFVGLFQQFVFLMVGFLVLFLFRKMPQKFLKQYALLFYYISLVLLFVVLVFHTSITNEVGEEARRWIFIPGGLTIQPSEIAKVSIIFYIAAYYSAYKKKMMLKDHLQPIIMIAIGAGLIAVEPNVSAAVVFGAIGLVTMVLGGFPLMLGVLGSSSISVLFYLVMSKIPRLQRRLSIVQEVFVSPDAYQLRQGLRAIVRGGLVGQGYMKSSQKFINLAFSSTDFIFAIICEEFGLIFGCLLLFLYFLLFYYILQVARLVKSHFYSILVAGIAFHLLFQALLHVAVTLAIFLPTGIPLPFISKGGSALILNLFEIGIVLNIAARLPIKKDRSEEFSIVA
ncbi:MAG: FtsW/RodA/SpoVE family cell cycle protein [Caldisericia bacterium]|nr:FtsW/RodA/SpoVE family cell cycle protein [Caldisericia bacterium]